MKKHLYTCCMLIILFNSAFAQQKKGLDRPKLVVGIVVDQMRWDYLYLFYDRYSEKGFKRMLNQGFSFENCQINYIPTYTAVGHSSIYTGSVPAIHGITGNQFIEQTSGKKTYCTEDANVKAIGSNDPDSPKGKMSPARLLSSTIGDELKIASNFKSKVIGISLKDRGSILSAGHAADAAFWFDPQSGNWITSSWYMDQLPKWLDAFNQKKMPEKYLLEDWHTLYPIETYILSPPQNNGYEKTFNEDDSEMLFPIRTSQLYKTKGFGLIQETPFGNTMTLDLAKTTIEKEKMGKGEFTDLLTLSLSSTDYIGHRFSINSIKIEDTYLRLDKEIGDFFTFLDNTVGSDNYLVFLTADHGAGHSARYLLEKKIPGGILNADNLLKDLNQHLATKWDIPNAILDVMNYQVHFDYTKISTSIAISDVRQTCIDFLLERKEVAYAFEMKEVASAAIPAPIKEMVTNGYNHEFCGEIQFMLKPGYYIASSEKGSTHGTWNPFDSHIPLVWMGFKIPPGGRSSKRVNITDIAPTIATLLHIQAPNGCIGFPLFTDL